jgi:MEDS: MEthanogen/methylotroph, DcmR Sensory domain
MGLPLEAALAPGLNDHRCHAYDGASEFLPEAQAYLADGIALGQRSIVIAPERELGLAWEAAAGSARDAGDEHQVEVLEFSRVFGTGPIDVDATLRSLGAVLATALQQGYTGLRAVEMLTHAATEPLTRRSFAAWEHAVGQWQSSRPVASACCFDRRVLGDKAVQEMACLHPRVVSTGPGVPFRLYFRAGQLVLEGEVDSFSAPLLAQAVSHVRTLPGQRLMIDARGLGFVNHRGMAALVDGLASRCGGVSLLGGPALLSRLGPRLGIGDELLDVLPYPW